MSSSEEVKELIWEELKRVIDPELGIDIVNLGLVYDVEFNEEGETKVTMTLTSMGCPLAGTIQQLVEKRLMDVPEITKVEVNIVWSPPWSKDMMSREAKIALGIR